MAHEFEFTVYIMSRKTSVQLVIIVIGGRSHSAVNYI